MLAYETVLFLPYFIFGLIIGSFLNVVIYRMGSGRRITGRSRCLSCGKTLTPRMLIPVLSFVFQGGRCAHCHSRISFQYPLVELFTGVLFVAVFALHEFDPLNLHWETTILTFTDLIIWGILVVVLVYDLRHKIIPDRLSVAFAVLAFTALLLREYWGVTTPPIIPFFDDVPRWLDLASGIFLPIPFALIWLLSSGKAMGLGDAKLTVGIGWFLGFTGGVSAILLSFWIAFFPSIALLFLPKSHFTMRSEIPFAPFLILGTLLAYFYRVNVFSWTF